MESRGGRMCTRGKRGGSDRIKLNHGSMILNVSNT